jgi:hypothetical protein
MSLVQVDLRHLRIARIARIERRPGGRPRSAALLAVFVSVAAVLLCSCTSSTGDTGASSAEGVVAGSQGSSATQGISNAVGSTAMTISNPGGLTLTPASGPTTLSPNWSTNDECPAGHDASAELGVFNLKGAFESRTSLPIEGPGPYRSAPGAGVLDFDLNNVRLDDAPDVGPDGTLEVAVGCYAGGTGLGSVVYVHSTFVHFSDNGATYTTSNTA